MWQYLFRVKFTEFLGMWKWDEICFYILAFILFYGIMGWIGIVLWVLFIAGLGEWLQGGMMGESGRYYFPTEEPPKNTCSAGIENCTICNNEYSHDFNLRYEASLKWWEKII